MLSFIQVAADIGGIEDGKFLKRYFNKIYKKECLNKIYGHIDKATAYVTNTELEEFIQCMGSVRGADVYKPDNIIVKTNSENTYLLDVYYEINIRAEKWAEFKLHDIGEDSKNVFTSVCYDNGAISVEVELNKSVKYGVHNMKDFGKDPRALISKIVNKEMKYVCACLVNKEEIKYVH